MPGPIEVSARTPLSSLTHLLQFWKHFLKFLFGATHWEGIHPNGADATPHLFSTITFLKPENAPPQNFFDFPHHLIKGCTTIVGHPIAFLPSSVIS